MNPEKRLGENLEPADKFLKLIEQRNGGRDGKGAIVLESFKLDDVRDMVRANPGLAMEYYDMVEKFGNMADLINLLKNAPEHAETLSPVLKDRPELLRIYSGYALKNAGLAGDRPFLYSRISTTTDADVVSSYLKKLNEDRARIEAVQLEGGQLNERFLTYLDVIQIGITKVTRSRAEESGVYIAVAPTGAGYSFGSLRFLLTNMGEINSRFNANDKANFGYLTRKGEKKEVGEREIIELLSKFDLDSKEFDTAFEETAERITTV
ncbi:MAG: hypothetical protein JNN11_03210 [Candidatus Doudnabacteria bacterium]|nr:hypothetical protein [Candidatus Doudnabacteria bacterium]